MATPSISLMYHDVVAAGQAEESGFPGDGAAIYKLTTEEFVTHLSEVNEALKGRKVALVQSAQAAASGGAFCFTFDDGGSSFYQPIAGLLEERGWRGHFFITTGRLDTPGFLRSGQVQELWRRGHVIGSHSHTHPVRMAACSYAQMQREWKASVGILAGLIGEPVRTASVPGGYFSREVAKAAEEAGIQVLFTSEPTSRVSQEGSCIILGRFAVRSNTPVRDCALLAAGSLAPLRRQALLWKAKKAAKLWGGTWYLRLREALLRR